MAHHLTIAQIMALKEIANNHIEENWTYEDQLPEMTGEQYSEWFSKSTVIDGVRMGPKVNI